MNIFWQRLIRSAALDPNVYDEVAKDTRALPQAAAVVLLSGLAAGVAIGTDPGIGGAGIAIVVALAFMIWGIWAMLINYVARYFSKKPLPATNLAKLLRAIGFSSSPGIIRVLGVFPNLQQLFFAFAAAWMLVAMVFAVKSVFGYEDTWPAVKICLGALAIQAASLIFIMVFFTGS